MEELWDKLLIHYITEGRDLVYGLATDDSHHYIEYKVGASNPGRGWIMVRSPELSASALITAMEKGDFYSTTGVELERMEFKKRKLHIAVKPVAGINYKIQFWGAGKSKNGGELEGVMLKEVKGTTARYKLRRKNLYVRARIVSTKLQENPFAEGDVETAWTQPIKFQ